MSDLASTWLGIGVIAVIAATATTVKLGQARWQQNTTTLRAAMQAARQRVTVRTYDPSEIEGLPPPVKRYFSVVLEAGHAIATSVRFRQQGQFRMDENTHTWQTFQASQFVTMQPPSFDWDARIRLAPGVNIWVRDTYAISAGSLRAAILGIITVANSHDTAASARGELMRYLAEAVWYPSALLPSQGVKWEANNDTSARATLNDGTTEVTLEFRFSSDGLVTEIRAASRPRSETESAPWLCRVSQYERRASMLVPTCGEVEWELSSGPEAYFKARMTDIDYEFAYD